MTRDATMPEVISRDGTAIAYERQGTGAPLVLVDGALCHRAFGPGEPLARRLRDRFTVYRYDRRGRGRSGDAAEWDVAREVEDLAAVIGAAGGRAHVVGLSSGAVLALEAAARGLPIDRLAVYEPPMILDGSHPPMPPDFIARRRAELAAGRRSAVVKAFLRLVGVPRFAVAVMRWMPFWRKLAAVAHTLPYDLALVEPFQQGRPFGDRRWADITAPALVLHGGKSPAYMKHAGGALAAAIPDGRSLELPRQTHMVRPDVLAPVLIEFLARPLARRERG